MTTRLLALLCAVMLLGGCETIKGAGRDVQTAGQVITGTAQEVERQF
jgi:entericidin B